jgi:predicted CoA-binding protein
MTPREVLESANTILVIDWPGKEVPESLAHAGFNVIVKGGPGPEDFSAYEISENKITQRRTGRAPDHADLIYSYRPLSELPEIIATAKSLGAKTIWTQSGRSGPESDDPRGCWHPEEELRTAQSLIEAAGLAHIASPYIVNVARELQPAKR